MLDAIIFPSSFFDKHTVDEDLEKEYTAAKSCGLYKDFLIFSYEEWFHHGKLILDHTPAETVTAAYRGWMMLPEQYGKFYYALREKNIELITTPAAYEHFHLFPNIYPCVAEDTPRILLFPNGTPVDIELVKKAFPKFMVKDYVKSVKGTNFPACFDASITQQEFDEKMEQFYQYRGHLFTGGICIKEFVDLRKYDDRKNEYRVFYINGNVATISRNAGQCDYAPVPPIELIKKYNGMESNFYTIDYAELADGRWIIIETGDGSVSGLSDFQDYHEFFRALYYCFA